MLMDSLGGKCWFSVDSKTIFRSRSLKGRYLGKFVRGPNFSSWIKFGGKGLALLVETCCIIKDGEPFRKDRVEGGRYYLLELRGNGVGWLLFCSLWSMEEKRFSLVFSKGRGFLRGWKILFTELRSLGVSSALHCEERRGLLLLPGRKIGGEERGGVSDQPPDLSVLRKWAQSSWKLTGKLHLALLGGPLILFEFKGVGEAERVIHSSVKLFNGKSLFLEWWNSSVGCLKEDRDESKVWVRIRGFPLHLWGKACFKSLGEACGSFVAVDEDMANRRNLQWARVLVGIKGQKIPSLLQVVVGTSVFVVGDSSLVSLEDLRNPAGGGKVSAAERMEADISVASLPKAIGWELQQFGPFGRNGNGAGSGRVAPIPTPPSLAKPIPIPVPFQKLNGVGRVWEILIPAPPRPV
ncbi:hypothetical protein CK203_070636 [Vitis vinifera]|uniref:DUF4283 domain-containing protein n=1 Tax=Vitis vinifera TaxID=29760 RepID=A0A438C1D2_VITVI|nr:hypothetical protein CK203_070636 [Vitis vinifera]